MKDPAHPGEILRVDVLGDLGLSVSDAAARLGVSRVTLSRVLHGHARVSPNLAVRLEQAGVGTARAWLAMQNTHDLAVERARGLPDVQPFVARREQGRLLELMGNLEWDDSYNYKAERDRSRSESQ